MARTAIPPTAPPAIAPALELELEPFDVVSLEDPEPVAEVTEPVGLYCIKSM
jgi:hypothetical protein